MKPALMFFWTAVTLYGVSTFSYIFGMIPPLLRLDTAMYAYIRKSSRLARSLKIG